MSWRLCQYDLFLCSSSFRLLSEEKETRRTRRDNENGLTTSYSHRERRRIERGCNSQSSRSSKRPSSSQSSMMFRLCAFVCLVHLIQVVRSIDPDGQCSMRDRCLNTSSASPLIYGEELFIRSRNCFCDSVCEQYGDCCEQSTSRSSPDQYECVDFLLPTISHRISPFPRLSVWMRTRCLPIYFGSQVDQQCRNVPDEMFEDNPMLFLPVTSLQTNITYRNYYCAYCNNDANEKIQFWEYKPFCHGDGSDRDYVTLSNDEQVQYYLQNLTRFCLKTILYPHERGSSQPSVFIRPCKQALPSHCPSVTSADLALKCSRSATAYRYVLNSTLIYRNPFCAQCHQLNSSEFTCSDPHLRSSLLPMAHIRIHPLSILFDPTLLKRYLNNNTIPRIIYSMNYNCTNANELYDLFENRCSTVTNSSDEFIVSMRCSYPMQTNLQPVDTISSGNGSLALVKDAIFLSKDEYVFISDQRIVFCADRWTKGRSSSIVPISFPTYRHVLSVICTSISLACLLLFAVVFCLIPSLHNLPGQCLLFLSISLFIGQFTFILTSNVRSNASACVASAILIHYFYLSSFVWLLILSIQIHSTFNRQIVQPDRPNKKYHHLLAYNALVWCSTGMIILIACLLQWAVPQSSFSPGYGSVFCSISKANAMIVFFLLPIGCLLFVVTILFIRTLLAIHRSRSLAKLASATSSSHTHQASIAFVYARLASLMGIQWILLILALVIGQTWSWIIFEIINSLPGVFICLGFLCSKRLFDTIKSKIALNVVIRRNSSRSTTTTSTLMSPVANSTKKFRF